MWQSAHTCVFGGAQSEGGREEGDRELGTRPVSINSEHEEHEAKKTLGHVLLTFTQTS